ncbi:MAG: D-2-hydroxyacid dehydrogenase [Clostridia bacterium]|nr:D-2-hydroxyacid dehydrogenase [Clostridia bacterium]
MKIVFLDAMTLTDAGADLAPFKAFGTLEEYPVVKEGDIIPLIADADIVFCNKAKLTAEKLQAAKRLQYIGVLATGFDNVDVDYCHRHGITVCNAGVYSTDNVAQQVFAFILHHFSKTAAFDAFVKQGGWVNAPTFSPLAYHTHVISEKTLGIFGFGNIGQAVAKIALAFGMKVLVCTRSPKDFAGVEYVDFEDLLAQSDILSVHCPLTEQTRGIFNREAFGKCKPGALFINTSRGPVVNETDLCAALEAGALAAAAVDVLAVEPMQADCPLRKAKNITFTPHIGWASDEAKRRLFDITLQNFQNYLAGHPTHVI